MDAYGCPKGHSSTEADFCSECGAKIQGAAAPRSAVPAPAVAAAPQATGEKCPDCGAERAADSGTFCEVCGFNFATGAHGELPLAAPAVSDAAPAPAPVAEASAVPPAAAVSAAAWRAVVVVDPSLRESGSPEPPAGIGPFTFNLDKLVSLIGRQSDSHAVFPEIPLNYDDAVSHRHALVQLSADGTLALRDIGSANGTRLNGRDLEPLVDTPLKDNDEITLGHWSRITIKAG